MTTVRANRPLWYMHRKYKKGDTFVLHPADGVLWGRGAITVVDIDEDVEDPPEFAKPRPRETGADAPDTLHAMQKMENEAATKILKKKGASPGDLQ